MHTMATLDDLRNYLGLATSETGDDARLLAVLEAATATIEQRTRRQFLPYQATRSHPVHDAQELLLRDDLLELHSVIDSDGATIALSDIEQDGGVLRLLNDRRFAVTAPGASVQVSGMWGYHPEPEAMWFDSGLAPAFQVSSGTNLIILSDITEVNGLPIFSAGQLLKLNDEIVRVVAVDTAGDFLTVIRGVRGTTAATHTNYPSLLIYETAPDARQLCVRWAAWLYRSADRLPEPLPDALQTTVRTLRRVRVMS